MKVNPRIKLYQALKSKPFGLAGLSTIYGLILEKLHQLQCIVVDTVA